MFRRGERGSESGPAPIAPPPSVYPMAATNGGGVARPVVGVSPTSSSSLDDRQVAEFLLSRRFHLAALELHQELLEGNNGVHNVEVLNKFFNEPNNYAALVRTTEAKAKENKASALGDAMRFMESPFAVEGLQPAVAARDQQIALLQYELRRRDADIEQFRSQLAEAGVATVDGRSPVAATNGGGGGGKASTGQCAALPSGSYVAAWLGSDEDGAPVTTHERRTLNALIRRYLFARGYRATAVAFADEVTDQDLGPHADDTELLLLPGARRSALVTGAATDSKSGGARVGGGVGAAGPMLSLLAMHRKRIAPIQALLESEAKNDSAIDKLQLELKAVHEQLDLASSEYEAAQKKVEELQEELLQARTVRGTPGTGTTTGPGTQLAPPLSVGGGASPMTSATTPATSTTPALPSAGGGGVKGGASSIAIAHAPAFLRVVVDAMPELAKHLVSRHRAAIIPILAAAIATDASAESRRGMLTAMLTLMRRPSNAERQVIRTQMGVLAAKLGNAGVENEIMPEVILLAKTGKTKERKALAALLCGAMSSYVSDKRCDALLATLADLAESSHAIVRVGVVDGLAQLAQSFSDRWSRTLQGGTVVGSNTAVEQASTRQFSQVEYIMWRCLFTNSEERDANELLLAAQGEVSLQIPPSLALFGTPQYIQALVAKAPTSGGSSSGGSSSGGSASAPAPLVTLQLPPAWNVIPPTLAAAVCGQLVPVVILWSYRLGQLWAKFLPAVQAMLADTMQSPGAVDTLSHRSASASAGGGGGGGVTFGQLGAGPRAAATGKLGEWHQRKAQLLLGALAAAAPRIRQCMFDEGYTVQFLGDSGASATPDESASTATSSTTQPAPAAATTSSSSSSGDFVYELFDFTSQPSIQSFPPEVAIAPRAGFPSPPPPMPGQQRQAIVLTGLLRGTAAVRKRRNYAPGVEVPPGVNPYQWLPVRDEVVGLSWPSLRFVVRNLVGGVLRQAACVQRTSQVGRSIVDAYADTLGAFCTSFGPAFTSYVIRPMFVRAFGIPLDIPPAPPSTAPPPAPTASGTAVTAKPVDTSGSYSGRQPTLVVLAQVLLGMPANASEARRAAMSASAPGVVPSAGPAPGAPPPIVNFASAGPKGSDWPLVLPELAWLHRDSPDNPSNWGVRGGIAKPPPEPNVPVTGGVWNAEALLPLYGSAVLASPSLQPKELLEHSLRALIVLVATNRMGWGPAQALLEDMVVRAGGGNSMTGTASATAANSSSEAGGAAGTTSPTGTSTTSSTSSQAVLQFMLGDVFPRAASAGDPAIRASVAGLYRSLIPLLSPQQLESAFLPTIRRLTGDKVPGVKRAAVRALAYVYSSSASGDASVQEDVNSEVKGLLAEGPKDIIVEILRAMMRAIPNAAPSVRDGLILDRLIEVSERVVRAAEAGADAMREFCATVGDIAPGDVHSAAAQAARKARSAAVQAEAPWHEAKLEELDEVSMVLCESFRAFGSCILSPETKGTIRTAVDHLLATDLLDPTYRDVMHSTFTSLFPSDADQATGVEEEAHAGGESGPAPPPAATGGGSGGFTAGGQWSSMFGFAGGDRDHGHANPSTPVSVRPAYTSSAALGASGGGGGVGEPETIGAGFIPQNAAASDSHGGDKLMTSFADAFRSTGKLFAQIGMGGPTGSVSGSHPGGGAPIHPTTSSRGLGLGGGAHDAPPARPYAVSPAPAHAPAPAPAAHSEPPVMSMASFAMAPAPAPGVRRPSGGRPTPPAEPPSFDMSAFMTAPAPAPATGSGSGADDQSASKWGMGMGGVSNIMGRMRPGKKP